MHQDWLPLEASLAAAWQRVLQLLQQLQWWLQPLRAMAFIG